MAFAAEGAAGVVFADLKLDAAQNSADDSTKLATNPAYCPLALEVDVADSGSVQNMAAQALSTFGRIDYSVNRAGVSKATNDLSKMLRLRCSIGRRT